MTDTEIYVEVEALRAEIEGMKAENLRRESIDKSQAYGESMFISKADEIRALIDKEAEIMTDFNLIRWADDKQEACEWVAECPIKGITCIACGAGFTDTMSLEEAKVWWKARLADHVIEAERGV